MSCKSVGGWCTQSAVNTCHWMETLSGTQTKQIQVSTVTGQTSFWQMLNQDKFSTFMFERASNTDFQWYGTKFLNSSGWKNRVCFSFQSQTLTWNRGRSTRPYCIHNDIQKNRPAVRFHVAMCNRTAQGSASAVTLTKNSRAKKIRKNSSPLFVY